MDRRDDHALLEAVARRRDQEAYTELLRRYEKRAYNLALHVTGRHDLAQDAVQEAMLEVWIHAPSYRPGNPTGWVLRIVANRGLGLARRLSAKRERVIEPETEESASPVAAPAEAAERGETIRELGKALERLPALERQMLALRYGAGLTLDEIGAALPHTKRTIIKYLRKGLDRMRLQLEGAGCANAPALLAPASLGQALLGGFEPPPEFSANLLKRLAEINPERLEAPAPELIDFAPRSGGAAMAGKGPGIRWLVPAAILSGVLVGSGLFLVAGSGARQPPAKKPAQNIETSPAPPGFITPGDPVSNQARFHKLWLFEEEGLPAGFELVQGDWHWARERWRTESGKQKYGVLLSANPAAPSCLLLPGEAPPAPFAVRIAFFSASKGKANVICGFSDGRRLFPSTWWDKGPGARRQVGEIFGHTFYFLGSGCFFQAGNEPQAWVEYEAIPPSANRICLVGRNAAVTKIIWQQLDPRELPAACLELKSRLERQGVKPWHQPGGAFSGSAPQGGPAQP